MPDARTLAERRDAARQRQFLDVVSSEEAVARFRAALQLAPLGVERVALARALNRVVGAEVIAPVDVPAFDRANVDGFALRAEDTAGATEEAPRVLLLSEEVLTPGVLPRVTVRTGHASLIATGGMLPRGADAVVMVEDTEPVEVEGAQAIQVRRSLVGGSHITFAGTDIGRGETVLREGQLLTSREVGLLAAVGLAEVPVYRRPRVAVVSTGDELVQPGDPLPTGGVYDSNSAIVAAALEEMGCEPVKLGAARDERSELDALFARALECDAVILSGGTSKGTGDLAYEAVGRLTDPGIVVHGVAIKPGKPLCLAVTRGKPVVILPGFPTSAIFTFHQFVAPVLRLMAGLPEADRGTVEAQLAIRVSSELGRTEFLMVGLMHREEGYAAYPMGKSSGAVTSFSLADGFIQIPAQTDQLPAGTPVTVQLLAPRLRLADLIAVGSHCLGLDYLLGRLQRTGLSVRSMHVGSQGGLAAARRGECDLAGIHLMDPGTGVYNRPFVTGDLELVAGYRRMQGVVFRAGDRRFAGAGTAEAAVASGLADPDCVMVNRNAGSGTRVLIDGLLGTARPPGYEVQTRSHNAVAAAVAQGRADWGVAIDTVARMYGLGFLPLREECYDFVVPRQRLSRRAVREFLALLATPEAREGLAALGFRL